MKGDFSRNTFDRRHRFSRVLMQQGRVLLDADWNEQNSILLHYIRTLAADLIGPHGGPGNGFKIDCSGADGEELSCDFTIGWGRYYVDGILVENLPPAGCRPGEDHPPLTYTSQPDYPLPRDGRLQHDTEYLVFLDVWERHVTHLEADHIREVALGGPDTATRARVVWQVRVARASECGPQDPDATCADLLARWRRKHEGFRCLRARARVVELSEDPCIIPPEASYRGPENQLYRVEIHDGGEAGNAKHGATFKWSRDNGSVVFPIRDIQANTVHLETLGPDERRGLEIGDWVEFIDDRLVLRGEPGVLARVDAVDRVHSGALLALAEGDELPAFRADRHPILRRWDHESAAIPVREGKWVDLEDGVQVYFEPDGIYRTGDHWLVPARTATGDVAWPAERNGDGPTPQRLPPQGVEHHYAPLARISVGTDGVVTCLDDCRCIFHPPCAVVIESLEATASADDPCTRTFTAEVHGPEPLRYHWDFGDGVTLREGPTATHTYQASDLYTVRLTVSSDAGRAVRELGVMLENCGRTPNDAIREADRVAGLVRINSVGETRARALMRAGHETPAAVAELRVEEIQSLLNVSRTVAETIRESATNLPPGRSS